nr:hypothetical protein B0A51_00479 [Rachicladosporium sp. CCFEE 5018]
MAKAKGKVSKTTPALHAGSKSHAGGSSGVGTAMKRAVGTVIDVLTRARSSQARSPTGTSRVAQPATLGARRSIGTDREATVTGFLRELHGHFTSRSDGLSAGFLEGLCDSYNAGTLDERGLYVGILRVLINTKGLHLLEQFRGLLPASWKATDLGWLECAVAEDCAWQAKVAGIVLNSRRAMSTPKVKAAKAEEAETVADVIETDEEIDDEGVEVEAKAVVRKKKRPLGGFRAQSVSHIVGILEEPHPEHVQQAPTKKQLTAPKATPKKPARRAPTKAAIVTAQNDRSPSSISPVPSPTPSPLLTNSDFPFHPTTTSTPLPAPKSKLRNISIPMVSAGTETGTGTNTGIGRIFPTRRSILSVASKPYTHTLCGATFPHPSDVRQHHKGKVGSTCCWVKHGSPVGRDWDEDPNCKVRIGTGDGKVEVEVLRGVNGEREGQEGFRGYKMKSWGAWAALLAPNDDGAVADAIEDVDAMSGVKDKDGAEDQGECEAPVAKKRKVVKDGEDAVGAYAEEVAALGLRAGK